MRRRLLNLAMVLLLLLLVVTAGLWLRSCWRYDGWSWGTRSGRAGIESFRGSLRVGRVKVPAAALTWIPRGQIFDSVPAAQALATYLKPSWSFAGFAATSMILPSGYTVQDIRVPYWAILIATAIPLPLIIHKLRQVPPGCCRKCRYDLTGNVSGVCPECGMRIC